MAELVVTSPEGTVFRYRLGSVTILGRHPDCDIVLNDPMSSRRHCKIEQTEAGDFFVEDNSSANGTVMNGEFLRVRRPLSPVDWLQIGSTRMVLVLGPGPDAGLLEQTVGAGENFDPNMSIVRLKEDKNQVEVSYDYTMAAGKGVVTEEEESTSDLVQLKRVTARLKLLLDLGATLGASLKPRKVLESCLDRLFEVFPYAERGFILLFGSDGNLPTTMDDFKDDGGDLEGPRGPISVSKIRNPEPGEENAVAVSRTVVNRVREQRQSVLLSDAGNEADGDFSPAMSMARLEIRSVMCAPLVVAEEDLGILYLDTKDPAHRFGPDDLNLLNAVAGQMAVVIKNAELARQAAAEAASRENLQRFLSPHLVDQIMKKEMTVELGGSLKTGTVFFSDIVGFTRMAAQMRPSDVMALLNRYFRVMQEIIFARQGTIDKTGGDAIMAFWGVLVDTPQSSAGAATAAVEMQNAMFAFNNDLAKDDNIVKPPAPLGHGIGLNTGEFVAGNIGSERKIEFTVIGNAVNLAQRVESIAGRGQVFVGQGTYDTIKERSLVFQMPDCPVKNVDQPIKVYSLRGIIPPGANESALSTGSVGQTSRVSSGAQEMLFSMPCVLRAPGQNDLPALVIRLVMDRNNATGRAAILVERPLPANTLVTLHWTMQEKPNLPTVQAVVEHTWAVENVDKPEEGSEETASRVIGRIGTSLVDVQHKEGSMILQLKDIPEDILDLRPGTLIASDLKSFEEMTRH